MTPTPADAHHPRLAGLLIGGTALVETIFVTHHPVAPQGTSGDPYAGLAAVAATNLAFHALLMLVLVGQLIGLILFAARLGVRRPLALAGLVFCGFASMLMVLAMTFDGFVVWEILSRCTAAAGGCTPSAGDALATVRALIQAFTKLGFGAQSLGFAALGMAVWGPDFRLRVASTASVAAALGPFALLVSGAYVGPHQLMQILAMHAVWGLLVATLLAFRRI